MNFTSPDSLAEEEARIPKVAGEKPEEIPQFTAEIMQAPIQGRMTGYSGSNVKRMLDPLLVVELCVHNVGRLTEVQIENLRSATMCHVVLIDEDKDDCLSLLANLDDFGEENNIFIPNLVGQTCLPCLLLPIMNFHAKKKFIFPFTDLSIRSPGRYRFKCTIFHTQT